MFTLTHVHNYCVRSDIDLKVKVSSKSPLIWVVAMYPKCKNLNTYLKKSDFKQISQQRTFVPLEDEIFNLKINPKLTSFLRIKLNRFQQSFGGNNRTKNTFFATNIIQCVHDDYCLPALCFVRTLDTQKYHIKHI